MTLIQDLNERSPEWARSPILAGYRGSQAHGTYIPPEEAESTDDIDLFGVAVRDVNYYIGLNGYRPERKGTFSSAGEMLDIETHEVRKFCHLLMKGNPNVHQHLWIDKEDYVRVKSAGQILIDAREQFLSKALFKSYAGYANGQFKRMEKFEKRGYMGTKREAIVKDHGYDIKNAAHCLRLLYGAIHLAQYNTIQVRLDFDALDKVMAVKRGMWSLDHVKRYADRLFDEFSYFKEDSTLPGRISIDYMNSIVTSVILTEWEERGEKY